MSRFNPHFPNAASVFDAAAKFKQRCLLDQHSLLLDGQTLWTTEHFQALIDNYVKQPDVGQGGFYEKLAGQLATCEALDVALMTEVFWIVNLGPTNLLPHTKLAKLKLIWDMKPATTFPDASPFVAPAVLSGLGSGGPGYNQYLWMEMVFAVEAFAAFLGKPRPEREALLGSGTDFATWLETVPSGKGRQFYHALCHLLFPAEFERIFSQGHKNKVARAHEVWSPGLADNRPTLDAVLLKLRKRLETEHGQEIDYYMPPVGTLIKQDAVEPPKPVQQGVGTAAPAVGGSTMVVVGEPEAVYAPESAPTLRIAENLVLFGPPGTGKTFEC